MSDSFGPAAKHHGDGGGTRRVIPLPSSKPPWSGEAAFTGSRRLGGPAQELGLLDRHGAPDRHPAGDGRVPPGPVHLDRPDCVRSGSEQTRTRPRGPPSRIRHAGEGRLRKDDLRRPRVDPRGILYHSLCAVLRFLRDDLWVLLGLERHDRVPVTDVFFSIPLSSAGSCSCSGSPAARGRRTSR